MIAEDDLISQPGPASGPRRWRALRARLALVRIVWSNLLAFAGAVLAMLPLLPRRRPVGVPLAAPGASATEPAEARRAAPR